MGHRLHPFDNFSLELFIHFIYSSRLRRGHTNSKEGFLRSPGCISIVILFVASVVLLLRTSPRVAHLQAAARVSFTRVVFCLVIISNYSTSLWLSLVYVKPEGTLSSAASNSPSPIDFVKRPVKGVLS